MADNPYQKFDKSQLILRDELAIDRTILANERTVLAYARTALALVIAGLTFIHFIQEGYLRAVGFSCIPLGILTGLYGCARFLRMRSLIRQAREQAGEPAPDRQAGTDV